MNTAPMIDFLRGQIPDTPDIAIILGSGLGGCIDMLHDSVRIDASEIPGYPCSDIPGHEGALYFGTLSGKNVLAFSGRLHVYEGHSAEMSALPVYLAHRLGARFLMVFNAAGGINKQYRQGDFMLINDYMALPPAQRGFVELRQKAIIERGASLSAPDRSAGIVLRQSAQELGICMHHGTYAYVLGPSYETRAEIAMLRHFGADAVGMSTVPELMAANQLLMSWVGISNITNVAGGAHGPVLHRDVTRVAHESGQAISSLLKRSLSRLIISKY